MKKTSSLIAAILLAAALAACSSSLKASRPVVPLREYDKQLVGSLLADYVGNERCLKACHAHDQVAAFLSESVHGQQKVEGTAMPLVNCETCHGPGSEAIEANFIQANSRCDTSKFIVLSKLPAPVQSHLCLKCHSSFSMTSMQFWPSSDHAVAQLACTQCHRLHQSVRQKKTGGEINDLCFSCHREVRTTFGFTSRHPVLEGNMVCVECHDPHGTGARFGLKAPDEKGLCINCHGQFIGPFAFEHADVTDNCSSCHRPHGSVFPDLLVYQEPFLCLQCHTGHTDMNAPSNPSPGMKAALYTRCTACHSQIHGTDVRGPHPGSGLTQ